MMGATMSKKNTKLERNIQYALKSKRKKRQPYGLPLKRKVENLAIAAAIINRRKRKDDD
jgi:hypothetical protein